MPTAGFGLGMLSAAEQECRAGKGALAPCPRGEAAGTLRFARPTPPYLSLTAFSCANPFSTSGASARSAPITRQIALPMKSTLPVMVQITLV